MATYTSREAVVRRIEYAVPSGDAIGEFDKAYSAALADWRQRHGKTEADHLYDDWATVESRDEQVVITFTVEEKPDADRRRIGAAKAACTEAIRRATMHGMDGINLAPIWDALTGPAGDA